MKRFFLHKKLVKLSHSMAFIMSVLLLLFIFFIILVYLNKKADTNNTATAICIAVTGFATIMGLLYQIHKERRLRSNEKNDLTANDIMYRSLIENAGVVMYTASINGLITFTSSKAFELTGYEKSELLGMHFSELVDPDDLETVGTHYSRQVANNIKETTIDFRIRTREGDMKCVEQSAVLIFENDAPVGFQCIVKDISERKEMEKILRKYEVELVQNQELLQSILDNATSLMFIKDLEGKYLLINKQFKETFNVTDDMVIGKTVFDFADPGIAQRFNDTDDEVLKTCRPVETEEIIEMADGKHNILIIKFPLLNAQDKIYGISGIGTDITERVRYQEQLILAKKSAEDAKKLQEQFLANMSHEIRTPMNGIQGMTDLLLETQLNDEQRDFAQTIKRSSDNLLVIINDILDFSKIQAGKLVLEKINFKLNEVLENVAAIFRQRINEKGLFLKVHVDSKVPTTLNGDPYRLNQILVNLVGNAIKFTSQGGIDINISIEEAGSSEIILNFKITDTGIGIEAEKINNMFESFTQASIETTRKYGGTGLGLAITKQLLEMQRGHISAESKVNSGTTFTFLIPYNYSEDSKPLFLTGKDPKNYQLLLSGRKILVAEDNPVNQKVVRYVLQKAGGAVAIANNGAEAIAILKKNSDYDLIIMDLQMPEMDGYEATKYIRNEMNLSIPIIAMTASALKGEKAKCLEIGMNDYLSKPFDFNFLYKRINLLLNAKPEASPEIHEKKESDNLFDLGLLEEMDDNEYLSDVLSIFLKNTPAGLIELKNACNAEEFQSIHKIAHKLKSSVALVKANKLLDILKELEQKTGEEDKNELCKLCEKANEAYKNVEIPLTDYLKKMQTKLGTEV